MFDIAGYQKANTVAEAVDFLSQDPQAIPIAGGTDVLIRLREGHPEYRRLIDIHDLPELKGISKDDNSDLLLGRGDHFH